MREIIFDTETTGLDPVTGDRIVEIGCIEMVNRVATGREYHCYLNPERPMPWEAEQVHGLSDMFLSDKPLFANCVGDLIAFIADSPMVAHNAGFDFRFLNHELEKAGHAPVCLTRMVDTLALARTKFGNGRMSLDALCTRFGIDRSHRTKHGALLDAELLAQVYVELTGGRQIGLTLVDTTPGAGSEIPALASLNPARVRTPRDFEPSLDDIARHAAFIATITNPLWLKGKGAN